MLQTPVFSRHSGVHFFDISNSETVRCRPETYVFLSCFTPLFRFAPNLVCFAQFDLETCFAPQRRALFQHLNFQNCSEPVSFLHFSLPNVLRATTACYFSTSQLPEVLRARCVLYVLTSTCASRHDGVQFFISHLARWLRARRFSEPTFRPSGATNHWKNTVLGDFPTFSHTWIFF